MIYTNIYIAFKKVYSIEEYKFFKLGNKSYLHEEYLADTEY